MRRMILVQDPRRRLREFRGRATVTSGHTEDPCSSHQTSSHESPWICFVRCQLARRRWLPSIFGTATPLDSGDRLRAHRVARSTGRQFRRRIRDQQPRNYYWHICIYGSSHTVHHTWPICRLDKWHSNTPYFTLGSNL